MGMKKKLIITGFMFLFLITVGCDLKKEVLISGKTMGTTYHIKIASTYFKNITEIEKKIDNRLKEINRSMSTYIKDSEISIFNATVRPGKKFLVSEDFWYVINVAARLYKMTDGAWDGTLKPLVDLWGFGRPGITGKVPLEKEIKKLLAEIGFRQIDISETRYIKKRKSPVTLDFASIAKGYAVDQIAVLIAENGFRDFLVEIGGEVFASGVKKSGMPWKVGINRPRKGASSDTVYKAISLRDKALATSGDYRNFFDKNGRRYSHILNPVTGYPVNNGMVSVSIVAKSCTFADGLATAVMVMGHEKGLALVNRLDNVECLIVRKNEQGKLLDYYSKGFMFLK